MARTPLTRVSAKATIADEIRYGLNHWDGLTRFLDDGRIELDTNIVERGIRPIVLNRKNALFAGHDEGAEQWPCIASLIVLTRLVNLWPASRIDELMPWAWPASFEDTVALGAQSSNAAFLSFSRKRAGTIPKIVPRIAGSDKAIRPTHIFYLLNALRE